MQLARRERAQLLAVQERAARQSMERFFTAQTAEVVAAMRRGHKDSREDFRQRIQSGLGLTFDIEAARRLAKEALEQLIDWNAQDEALAAVLNPVWEEAFQAGARSMEEAFGIKALQAPRLTDYLRQYGLEPGEGDQRHHPGQAGFLPGRRPGGGREHGPAGQAGAGAYAQGPGGACGVHRAERGPHKPAGREL